MSARLAASLFCCLICADASAQTPPPGGGGLLRAGRITATGQTVPDPKTLPPDHPDPVDRSNRGKDVGRTDYGICKGC